MSNLMLHKGTKLATIEELMWVKPPEPSGCHFPISHGYLYEQVMGALYDRGMSVKKQELALTPNGDRFFGALTLDGGNGWTPTLGMRSSYDKRFAPTLMGGSRVWICDNLAWSAEWRVVRKNTRYCMRDLPGRIETGLSAYLGNVDRLAARYEQYRRAQLSTSEVDHILMNMVRCDALPPSKLRTVWFEYDQPRHEEHLNEHGARTAWTLFNAVTEILKGTNAERNVGRTIALHQELDNQLVLN